MVEKQQQLLQQLESNDTELRIAAIKQIPALSSQLLPLPFLSIGLGDKDWRVRKVAVDTFNTLDSQQDFIPDLIKLLYQPDNAGLRNSSIALLIGLGSQAVAALKAEIVTQDVEVRKFIIDILGEIGDTSCAEEIINSLADPDINVRYAAVETLGKLQINAAINPLLELMDDPDQGLKFTILQSLGQIGGEISTETLFTYLDDRLLRKALFDCFAKIGGAEVIPPLVNGLCDFMRQVREAAINALNTLYPQYKQLIKEHLTKSDADLIAANLEFILSGDNFPLKKAALNLYGSVGAERDLRVLLDCVAEEGLRLQTVHAFSELGEGPFSSLVDSLSALSSLQMLYMVFIGGELCFSATLPIALKVVRSADPQLRGTAAMAIGNLGNEGDLEFLIPLLDDSQLEIQDMAALAIVTFAKRHSEMTLNAVAPLLGDLNADKRMRAIRIFGLIGGEQVEPQLLKAFKDSSVNVRCETIRALSGHNSDDVVSGLTLALTDESSEVRRLAVCALGQCSQEQVVSALILASCDADFTVRSAVMTALVNFSGEVVDALLLKGIADSIGLVIISALESSVVVMPGRCQDLLVKALDHQDEEVVKASMHILSRLLGTQWISPYGSELINHSHWDVRLQTVRYLGQSDQHDVSELLQGRLLFETQANVRQALENVLINWQRLDRQES